MAKKSKRTNGTKYTYAMSWCFFVFHFILIIIILQSDTRIAETAELTM